MEVSASLKFLLKWNRIFFWIFIFSYTTSTTLFVISNGMNFGIPEILRALTVVTASVILYLSYKKQSVYLKLYKYSYIVVYQILINTTLTVINMPTNPIALIYYGASVFVLTYMYLDKWHLIAYEISAYISSIIVYWFLSGGSVKVTLIGSTIQLLLLAYVTVFFHSKKLVDDELIKEIEIRKNESELRAKSELKLKELKLFYKSLSDNSPHKLAVIDIEGRYIYVNKITVLNEQMRNWIIGKTDREYLAKIGKDINSCAKREMAIKECIRTLEDFVIEDNCDDDIKYPFGKTKIYRPLLDKNGEILRIAIYS